MYKLRPYCYFVLAIVSLQSCTGQSQSAESCKNNYKEAKNSFNLFYKNNDSKDLSKSLGQVEKSLECPETRKASIELKISILSTQKEYIKAYEFINSLNKQDFNKPYKKDMQANLFMALNHEAKSDNIQKIHFYTKGINEIQNYISTNDNFDEEAYYDLFLLKSKVLSNKELDEEIKSLISTNPKYKEFFIVLGDSFNNEPKKSEVVRD